MNQYDFDFDLPYSSDVEEYMTTEDWEDEFAWERDYQADWDEEDEDEYEEEYEHKGYVYEEISSIPDWLEDDGA